MILTYWKHSCFSIDDVVVTDPYHQGLGFRLPPLTAKVVTLSHDHFDHNNAQAIGGNPIVLRGQVDTTVEGMRIRSIACFHDAEQGRLRGLNYIYVIHTPTGVVCHMGDVGEPCSAELCRKIGPIDVLLVPVGGHYTIDAIQAKAYAEALRPSYVVPMHYRTADGTLDVATVDAFVSLYAPQDITRIRSNRTATEQHAPSVLLFN